MELVNQYNFQCPASDNNILQETLWEFKCLLYAIPSIVAYFFVFMAIRLKKNHFLLFSSIYSHSVNVACWIGDFVFTTIFSYSPLCLSIISLNHTYYLSVPYFLYNCFPIANFVCSIAISVHQLTAVFNPVHVDNIWIKLRHFVTMSSIIIPILMTFHIILGYQTTVPMPHGFIYVKVDHWFKQIDFITAPLMNSIAGVFSFIIIVTCTSASIIKIILMKKTNEKRVRIKMFLVASWMCSSSLIFAIYQFFLYYARFVLQNDYSTSTVVYYRNILADLCFLPLPWMVLTVNKRVRTAVLMCELKEHPGSTFSTVTVIRRLQ